MLEGQQYEKVNGVPMSYWDGPDGSKLYLVHTPEEWEAFYSLLMQQDTVACDTETSGFDYYADHRIVGLSFGWGDTHFYAPVRHVRSELGGDPPEQLSMDAIRDSLRRFFAQESVVTIWHNWKFDAHFYQADGIPIKTLFHDTAIMWQLYDENAPAALKSIASGWTDIMGRRHRGIVGPEANKAEREIDKWRSLEARERRSVLTRLVNDEAKKLDEDPLFQGYTKLQKKAYIRNSKLVLEHPYYGKGKQDVHYGVVPVPMMCKYAALDTYLTWRVYQYLLKNLKLEGKLLDLYLNELQLAQTLFKAEEEGVKIDRDYLVQLREEYTEDVERRSNRIREILGEAVNLNSPKQLSKTLRKAGVPLKAKTDSAATCAECQAGTCEVHFATDAKTLNKLSQDHEIVDQILELRTVSKLLNTYVIGILEKLTPDDILHCSFNQNVKTGRMSSTNPNLQNIPGRDTSIRRAFISPGPEYIYLFCDYSQVEVRLTAHYSRDPLLLDAYEKGQDIHTRTMCEMFNYPYDEVAEVLNAEDESHSMYKTWKTYRNISKRINFGIIYGVGAPGLADQIPRPEQYATLTHKQWVRVCQGYIDQYLDKYLGVKRFINSYSREVAKEARLVNHFGRVRRLPHAHATRILADPEKSWMESRAKRQGVNFLIQGTAADLFKIAAVRVDKLLRGTKSKIVNFVHDEVQIYLHTSELSLVKDIKREMEDFPEFIVPIIADIEMSTSSWADKHGV